MIKFCEFLREQAMKIINFKKKKIINFKKKKIRLLTKEQQELYENAKVCFIR